MEAPVFWFLCSTDGLLRLLRATLLLRRQNPAHRIVGEITNE